MRFTARRRHDFTAAHMEVLGAEAGYGPALTDLLAGNIQVMVGTLASESAQLAAGNIKVQTITESQRFSA